MEPLLSIFTVPHLYYFVFSTCTAPAAVFVEEDVKVETQLIGTVSYFQYELPDEGLTLRLNVDEGRVVLYASTRIRNPNSALYDIRLETEVTEDVFVSPDDFVTTGEGMERRERDSEEGDDKSEPAMIFVTVEGLEKNNSYILETTFGDTSTSELDVFACLCAKNRLLFHEKNCVSVQHQK